MKTVLITGVGRGIGFAEAEKFLKEGYFVIGTYRESKPNLQNESLALFELDLSKSASIKNCVEAIKNFGKKINILINNAGVLLDEDDTEVYVDKLRKTLEVNLIGAIDFTEQIIPLIEKSGQIINTASSAGSLNLPATHDHYPYHYPSYKISKTALNMYTKTLAQRLKSKDITVSSVHPGWVKTDMGGEEADLEPSEAAEHIYRLAISHPETGQFWYKGEKFPW